MAKKSILITALVFSLGSHAQTQEQSVYSFFGIGTSFQAKTIEESSMGGVGAALSDPTRIYFSNPASLSQLRFTNYSVGLVNARNTVKNTQNQQKTAVFRIPYVALGVPLGKTSGFMLGVRAKTASGYQFASGDLDSATGKNTFEGKGGSNSVFLGLGTQLFRGFSIGFEGSYVFGNFENTLTQEMESQALDLRENSVTILRGFDSRLGLHYRGMAFGNNVYSMGLTFQKKSAFNLSETTTFYNGNFASGYESISSTLVSSTASGTHHQPLTTTMGLGYGEPSKWFASAEYSFRDPLSFSGNVLENNLRGVIFGTFQRISLGGYYQPKYNSLTNYFSRIVYRFGIRHEQTGLYLQGTQIRDFGTSFGVSMPVGKRISSLNIGLEYGKRGAVTENSSEETYLRLNVSLTLGDKWFLKRKIN